ncbi:reprolysin-like metallopeptidase [Marilutibacter spongiae]|uniref:VCBS repeat-containing protein n=1 Tax=Marilutibacter spongiae TaxID=2025720 RepID=A0A7W3TJE3_9GAMM|nr:FG-GAP-like repeat-containing protein [Lysobacter spongiae]MBB1059044.1 VCBS repeat-containing protein [Lysobacter spongiae]
MKKLSLLLIPLVLCACSQDWSSGLQTAQGPARPQASDAMAALPSPPSGVQAGRASSFAAYPDRGALAHYTRNVPDRKTGAYTWHAAELSEAHAFRAIATGEMTFEAPDGTPIKLAYQRHIEHPDGNWSWVGEAEDGSGQTAVITFGPDAAFGTIPQGNDLPPLRLTLADGRAWVVSADKGMLGEIRNQATHPDGPDFLVPPRDPVAASSASGQVMHAASAPVSAAATTSATTVIDVLVGYTNGFASSKGSQSAAVTRIRNLVDITNQAYVSSQINAELRLVHSMQVTFPDNTSNNDALEKLTGFRAPSTQTTPDPAFSALRAARETYGADLVALVRKFNDPENDGCGVAWLLGGGMTGIAPSDEYFAYSVVSDGQDAGDDGKTYFCREETFAHEIGHNLGSQHDIETSKDDDGDPQPGAYSYSYGYKTSAAAGDFYTIMAYGDSGQASYRVFSNPSLTTCGGRACGSATADNARSINNTASIIAGFRPSAVSADAGRNDIDGDGLSDLVWRYAPNGVVQTWYMQGLGIRAYRNDALSNSYRFVGKGDLDGDGLMDLIWQGSDYRLLIWRSTGSGFQQISRSGMNSDWRLESVADINRDGRADLIWRQLSSGYVQYWLMNSAQISSYRTLAQSKTYSFLAAGDFNGDGYADIAWRKVDNRVAIWTGNGSTFKEASLNGLNRDWAVIDAFDVNGDGRSDLVWRHGPTGTVQYWLMNGTSLMSYRNLAQSTTYRYLGSGDFDGDGIEDMAWHKVDSRVAIWKGNRSTFRENSFNGLNRSYWTTLQ